MEEKRHDGGQTYVKDEQSSQTPPTEGYVHQLPQTAARIPSEPTQLSAFIERAGILAQNVKRALGVMDPEDLDFDKDIQDIPSASGPAAAGEYGFRDTSPKPDLAHYQKYFSTPKTTRSMTQSSRGNRSRGEAEEEPNTDGALSMAESDIPRISAFAKLEFDDGEFYMNTYSVELGRDLSSTRQAFQKAEEPTENVTSKRRKRSASSGVSSHVPRKKKRRHGRHHPSSVVSEHGGVIAVDRSDSESFDGYKIKKAKSTSSSSLQMSRKSSMLFAPQPTDYQALAMESLMGASAFHRISGSTLPIPSPEACPLIPIHPPASRQTQTDELGPSSVEGPGEDTVGSHKAISRKHVRIAFCFEKHYFQIHILGRNGAYVDDEFCAAGDVRALTNGSLIQIGGVSVKFQLPDVALGDTGAESNTTPDYVLNGRPSFAERSSMDSSSEADDEDDEPESAEEEEAEDEPKKAEDAIQATDQRSSRKKASKKTDPTKRKAGKSGKSGKQAPEPETVPPVPKRKGPGRPPKNGIMSKREQALLARQAREEAKAAARKGTNGEPVQPKGKASKASPEAKQDPPSTQPNGKRKYTKRKSKAELLQGQQGTRESTEHTDSVAPEQFAPPKPLKEKKPPKPPRSPSPFVDRNTLTEEQLAKPTASYVVLIHEALTERVEQGKGPMSLNQIYSSIARKYPYFKFIVTTVGWQSSIRHNLLQHEAFEKIEREGKGWMWGLKAGVSIEKEKKRRPSPPQTQPQQYYPPPHMMQHPYPYYPGMPLPPNGHAPYPPYGPPSGMPPYMLPGMRLPPGYPPGPFPPPHRPTGHPLPIINAQADTLSTYQSPYGPSRSPAQSQPPSNAPVLNETSANGYPQPQASSAPPNHANGASTPAPTLQPARTPANISPEKQQKLDHFRAAVMQSMPDKTFGEHLLSSAIARTLGTQTHSSLPGHGADLPEHPQELFIMQTVRKILDEPSKNTQVVGAGAETPSSGDKGGESGKLTPGEAARRVIEGEVGPKGKEEERSSSDARKEVPPSSTPDVQTGGVPVDGTTQSNKSVATGVDDTSATPTAAAQEPKALAESET